MSVRSYIEKYAYGGPYIAEAPVVGLKVVVAALLRASSHFESFVGMMQACASHECPTELILVPYDADYRIHPELSRILPKYEWELANWQSSYFSVYMLPHTAIPSRKYCAGMARKLVMDEAVRRLESAGAEKGVIIGIDSDAQVDHNYLKTIVQYFNGHPKSKLVLTRFSMRVHGLDGDGNRGLEGRYHELHWRYCNQALRAAGFPHAHHALGASMAVRSDAYQQFGGMYPGRQDADFHFLRKIIEATGYHELNDTCVYLGPSSYREHVNPAFKTADAPGFFSYHPQAFRYLQTFFKQLPQYYLDTPVLERLGGELPYILIDFLAVYFFDERISEIRQNSKNYNSFERRFYLWFNSAMVLRFLQFVRDNAHPNVRIEFAALDLLRACNYKKIDEIRSFDELLNTFRLLETAPRRWQLRFHKH